MASLAAIRHELETQAPSLWGELVSLSAEWTAPILARLAHENTKDQFPKTFNDPVWGTIELYPHEIFLLDSPLLQPLRGVKQLGMAQLVYPSASHDRLEHSRGVVEAATRMMDALNRNAGHRASYGRAADEGVPPVKDADRIAIRLAALLHDIGHGPFSHATEVKIEEIHPTDFKAVEAVLRQSFNGVTKVSTSETIAIMVVLSPALEAVFAHANYWMPGNVNRATLPLAIVARIMGAADYLDAPYLAGIVSGPIDADKLDYMARDCHHAGLPIGLDIHRLVQKLEVLVITPENAPLEDLKERARAGKHQRYYDVGLSVAGLGAYEQLVIGRVLLYDRLYYHHKVRAAEAMVRRMIEVAQAQMGRMFTLREMLMNVSDDTFIALMAQDLRAEGFDVKDPLSRQLARAIQAREIYNRAFAFAAKYLPEVAGGDEGEGSSSSTRALQWRSVTKQTDRPGGRRELAEAIVAKARKIGATIPELAEQAGTLVPEDVIVDLPENKSVAGGNKLLTWSEDGTLGLPDLFFDPAKWSTAYEEKKRVGFVFCPRALIELVNVAAKVVLYEQFGVMMDACADRDAKTSAVAQRARGEDWWTRLRDEGVVSSECWQALHQDEPVLAFLVEGDLRFPEGWGPEGEMLKKRLAGDFRKIFATGLPGPAVRALADTVSDLSHAIAALENDGYPAREELDEVKDLQRDLRLVLAGRCELTEGAELGGGESDLIARRSVVIENKVNRQATDNPFGVGLKYDWQARRYAIGVYSKFAVVMLAYKPATEVAVPEHWDRIRLSRLAGASEARATIRIVVPWGYGTPHTAKPPS